MEYEVRWVKRPNYVQVVTDQPIPVVLQVRRGSYEMVDDKCNTLDIIDVVSKLVWSEWQDVPVEDEIQGS